MRLFYLQGLSHREVAAELGISVGAVKARLHQARAALAPRLSPLSPAPKEDTMAEGKEPQHAAGQRPAGAGAAPEGEEAGGAVQWAAVRVAEVLRSEEPDPRARKHVMALAEEGGDRMLPIWIGPTEATVLALALQSVQGRARPFPYKAAATARIAAESTERMAAERRQRSALAAPGAGVSEGGAE